MTALILSLTAAGLILAVLAWVPKAGSTLEIVLSAVMLACLITVGLLLLAGDGVEGWRERWWNVLLLLSGGLALTGGGPLTTSTTSRGTTVTPTAARSSPTEQPTSTPVSST